MKNMEESVFEVIHHKPGAATLTKEFIIAVDEDEAKSIAKSINDKIDFDKCFIHVQKGNPIDVIRILKGVIEKLSRKKK